MRKMIEHSIASVPHLLDEVVHRLPRLDQQHDPPGLLQLGRHLLQGVRTDHFRPLRLVC